MLWESSLSEGSIEFEWWSHLWKKGLFLWRTCAVQTQVPSGERKGLSRAGHTGEEKMGNRGSGVGMQAPVRPAHLVRNNPETHTGFFYDMLLFFYC